MPPPERLSRREREIMDALHALDDNGTADEIRSRLERSANLLGRSRHARQARSEGRHHATVRKACATSISPTASRATARKKSGQPAGASVFFRRLVQSRHSFGAAQAGTVERRRARRAARAESIRSGRSGSAMNSHRLGPRAHQRVRRADAHRQGVRHTGRWDFLLSRLLRRSSARCGTLSWHRRSPQSCHSRWLPRYAPS